MSNKKILNAFAELDGILLFVRKTFKKHNANVYNSIRLMMGGKPNNISLSSNAVFIIHDSHATNCCYKRPV